MSGPSHNNVSRYVVNASSSIATAIIRMSALVWVNQYLLRRIEPAEYALVPVVASLLIVAELFPTVFLRGLARFMVEADARRDGRDMTSIVSSMVPVLFTVALVLFIAGVLAVIHIDRVITVDPQYRTQAQAMLLMLVSVLCIRVAATPFRLGLHVRMRFVEQNLILLGTETLRIVLLLVLLLAVSTQVLWVAVASSVANLVNMLILIGYTFNVLPDARLRLSAISFSTIQRLLSFSLWTLFQGLNNLVLKAVPALLLNRNSSAIDVASFHIGSLADTQIRKLVVAAAAPAKPALTTIYATEGESTLQSLYYHGGRYFLWVTLFLLPPLLVFAYPLIMLYAGDKYNLAAPVMLLLLGVYPLIWASGMFYEIAYAVGRIRAYNVCIMVLSLSALTGMWYFVVVHNMGALGAAIALSGAYVLVYPLLMWPIGLWLVRGKWSTFLLKTLFPGLGPFAAACLGCLIFSKVFPIDGWGKFFLGCGLSSLVYVGVLFTMCINQNDRELLVRARRKIGNQLKRSRK
ncbi:hypothetical protein [Ruegeria atlantica]|uniref:Polysaccharide biosynthesis protein n=1 Tax=Ruegeria atlantica TaxID=81569 RepID=A0A0P1EGT5_9RHOB|nr:hypothetical protein [Ruegeria atlantica]CUH49081.1 hypothetical protein RUA4292_03275 [Ruegeria atlantica]